ncbi:MAG TPA: hypothetical protein VLY04_00715 [Bryobacteraceae bacterium]|nr:hypothetical protein [Bryobacteraceae bacterium]
MDGLDVLVLSMVALADICLLMYLRRLRSRHLRTKRVISSLRLYLRREIAPAAVVRPIRQVLARAS